jgi:AcrR family transcriptional regulator
MSMADPTESTARPARRTQAERRDESERGLVQATIALVREEGVSAATFEAIGKKAGYSGGLVAQRFGSKQGLIAAVIGRLHDLREVPLSEIRIDEMSGLEALLTYHDIYLCDLWASRELRSYFMLLSSAVADTTSLVPLFVVEHDRIRQRIAAFVEKGQAAGEIRRELDPDALAVTIGCLQLGIAIQLLVDPSLSLERMRQTTGATLRYSLASPTA